MTKYSGRDFGYQVQRLGAARQCLMLPHPEGETRSIADAFNACYLGFLHFDIAAVDDENARRWIETIKALMDTAGIDDETGEGTNLAKARTLTEDERRRFAKAVDELASWFEREFWPDLTAIPQLDDYLELSPDDTNEDWPKRGGRTANRSGKSTPGNDDDPPIQES